MNQMRLIAKHLERGNSDLELNNAANWLVRHILPVIDDIWQPRRLKEWRPGARASGVTFGGNESLCKLLGDGTETATTDEGHTVWIDVPPDAIMLGKWRIAFKIRRCLTAPEWLLMSAEASRMSTVAGKRQSQRKTRQG